MEVVGETVRSMVAEVPLDPPDGEVHFSKFPGGRVRLLPVDADVVAPPAVGLRELLALDEHPARPAGGIVYPALVGRQHRHQRPDNTAGRVELTALLPLRARELREEILIDPAEDILRTAIAITDSHAPDEVHELAETLLVQARTSEVFRENAPQNGIGLLDRDHRFIDQYTDLR